MSATEPGVEGFAALIPEEMLDVPGHAFYTGEAGFTREQVGKITVTDHHTYVAVTQEIAGDALRRLAAGKLKGRPVKVRALED